ncbi:MAG: DUF4845 domain-containing protein [Thiobacillaceae bacterium]|nr:DUF4845 domain-containing protein [Thiobacillaceae bacterium]MCX7673563.1 DUF4845 domain-containing protein [Thiobacillaceae bacterium]MDW8323411.1 DUF4845 domain-containing protein [Burkholderiales bacterium]
MRHLQLGVTFGGLLLFGFLLAFVVYAGSRLVPPFLDYWAVEKALSDLSRDPDLKDMGLAGYRDAFEKRLYMSNITDVESKDLKMVKGDKGVRLTAAWTVRKPFIGPVNLCLDFEATSDAPQR